VRRKRRGSCLERLPPPHSSVSCIGIHSHVFFLVHPSTTGRRRYPLSSSAPLGLVSSSPVIEHVIKLQLNKSSAKVIWEERVAAPHGRGPHLIHIPRPTPLATTNGSRIQSAVLPQYTFRTDRHTYRHMGQVTGQ